MSSCENISCVMCEHHICRKDVKSVKADRWLVITGRVVYSCRTREQARQYARQNKFKYPQYNYVGSCFDKRRKIVLDI